MRIRRLVTILASFAITVFFLALALNAVDFQKLAQAFTSADYRVIAFASIFTLASYVLRTARWQRLLAPSKAIPLLRLFPVLVIGFALNNLLPGRPGEFARAYGLGQREGMSKTLGFATVVVERVMDGLALIAFLLIALAAFGPLHLVLPVVAENIAALATAVFGVALAGLIFLLVREQMAFRIFRWMTKWLPRKLGVRLENMLVSFTIGLHSLKSSADVVAIGALSLGVWACEAVSFFLFLTAFGGLIFPNRIVAAMLTMVLINLGIMIPAAPGGLGPYEAAGVFALGAFGLSETSSASVALAAHALQYLLITGLGLVLIWKEGMTLAQAEGLVETSPPSATPLDQEEPSPGQARQDSGRRAGRESG